MSVLDKIIEDKKKHVAQQKLLLSQAMLEERLQSLPKMRGFADALMQKQADQGFALIGEVKKASPSKGLIRADFNVQALAKAYEAGGATCLSVLTDQPYFQGQDHFIALAKEATHLPILRKDFMIDPYQIYESRFLGADCILLILAALSDEMALKLEEIALKLGLSVLIEVHDEPELHRALKMQSKLIGVNNRNLKDLKVDINTSKHLLPILPPERLGIAESGLYHHDDLLNLSACGAQAFLIGESLMRQDDLTLATKTILGETILGE